MMNILGAMAPAALVVLAASALPVASASADPDVPQGCLVLALATKRFEDLNDQVKRLDDPSAPLEQARTNTRQQVQLWRQMRDVLGEAAKDIKDAPALAEAVRRNAEAIGQYADVVEKLIPHSKDDPPSDDLKTQFHEAGKHKGDAGGAMTDAAREACAN